MPASLLRELHIQNLAVISDARIELSAGLNCFTGATGAGKSLVIGAIEILLGLRSPGEMLRQGAEEGRVSGVFEISDDETLAHIESITDIPATSELLLTRRLFASGRSSISLNGHPITLAMLRALSQHLIDIHGQHDQQYLLKPANQIEVLDTFAEVGQLKSRYHAVYQEWSQARRTLEELSKGRALRQQQIELYRFQAGEIDAAEPQPNELEQLQSRARTLNNVERLQKDAEGVYATVYDADESLVQRLNAAAGTLAGLADFDVNLQPIASAIKDAAIAVEESGYDLRRYLDRLELDPEELATINDRLTTLGRLASKYAGRTLDGSPALDDADEISSVLRYRQDIAAELAQLVRQTQDLGESETNLAPLEAKARKLAAELSAARRRSAGRLARLVEFALSELGMERAKFEIQVESLAELTPAGSDLIEFVAATNPGLPANPLRKIASGGELSRIMLALKGILAAGDRVSVLVFDEIDANVGGRLGSVIGEKLRDLASGHQVLCITHLPQIAAYANRHLTVKKSQQKDQTTSLVKVMEGEDRLMELAEMIGGHQITAVTKAQARELLHAATSGGQGGSTGG